MRMMQDVKTATVVIRNPTHFFAVALRYTRGKDPAPASSRRGPTLIALRIIAEAEKHGVPCIARPETARELYRTVKVGGYVPASLFKAVAAILAYVLRRNAKGATAVTSPTGTPERGVLPPCPKSPWRVRCSPSCARCSCRCPPR
jgi:flagellar biosynthetic protein FlhB